jgi:hypothetical protein
LLLFLGKNVLEHVKVKAFKLAAEVKKYYQDFCGKKTAILDFLVILINTVLDFFTLQGTEKITIEAVFMS